MCYCNQRFASKQTLWKIFQGTFLSNLAVSKKEMLFKEFFFWRTRCKDHQLWNFGTWIVFFREYWFSVRERGLIDSVLAPNTSFYTGTGFSQIWYKLSKITLSGERISCHLELHEWALESKENVPISFPSLPSPSRPPHGTRVNLITQSYKWVLSALSIT